VFFHNGVVNRLEDAGVSMRLGTTQPGKWYPRSATHDAQVDDLPPQYWEMWRNKASLWRPGWVLRLC